MNIAEVEKIHKLVISSPILSAQERAEWLALFDLMNDKQLLELEKILGSTQQSVLSNQPVSPTFFSKSKAEPPATSQLPPPAKALPMAQMPKLSHIMNLPNIAQAPLSKAQLPQTEPQKKPSIFAARLKALFMEKELPSGHKEFELELIDGKEPRTPGSRADESARYGAGKNQEPNQNLTVHLPLVNKFQIQPAPFKAVPHAFVKLPPTPPMPKAVLKPETLTLEINSLEDLAKLGVENLQAGDLSDLVNKIKLLIAKHGYFEVIFNLEKSPAYGSYIATGLKLLSQQSSFENLSRLEDQSYLSKEEFERFTDLLTKIQTS